MNNKKNPKAHRTFQKILPWDKKNRTASFLPPRSENFIKKME